MGLGSWRDPEGPVAERVGHLDPEVFYQEITEGADGYGVPTKFPGLFKNLTGEPWTSDEALKKLAGSSPAKAEWNLKETRAGGNVPLRTFGGFFGRVDVDAVDLIKYPKWAEVEWWYADLEAG